MNTQSGSAQARIPVNQRGEEAQNCCLLTAHVEITTDPVPFGVQTPLGLNHDDIITSGCLTGSHLLHMDQIIQV